MNSATQDFMTAAAFFDIDGTLLPPPSLERRFFALLRTRNLLPLSNYFAWLAQALRLFPRGIATMHHANKVYLRGVNQDRLAGLPKSTGPAQKHDLAETVARLSPPVSLFPAAVDRAAWHVAQGHTIVLVSGTLMPLAVATALLLHVRLLQRGLAANILVLATQLEEANDLWTGKVVGTPMFGRAKARALRQIARQHGFDLSRSYAYANALHDLAMLEANGRPSVVNPSLDLENIAKRRDWPIFRWVPFPNESLQTKGGVRCIVEGGNRQNARELILNEWHRHNRRLCK